MTYRVMTFSFHLLVLLIAGTTTLTVAQSSTQDGDIGRTFPAKIISSVDGVCPSEQQLADVRDQITDEVRTSLFPGLSEDNPASSCSAIPSLPTDYPSGYYWIQLTTDSPAVQVYCDFNRQCGCDGPSTWTRIAFLNMSDPSENCPPDWFTYTSPVRSCGFGMNAGGGSRTVFYSALGLTYSRVCGRVLGYQYLSTGGFFGLFLFGTGLDAGAYLSGVSLTHGNAGSRQHVWSFASARDEGDALGPNVICDCSSPTPSPFSTEDTFVGNDYFCDSGVDGSSDSFLSSDPLWDGEGCGPSSTCCQFNDPPWFCRSLPQPTSDDLEVRVLKNSGSDRDIPVELIEIYVQ